jgi:hypothetical protein
MPKKYILKKGVTIEYHFTKYTSETMTDAISKKLLLEVPSMVKFFEVTPTKRNESRNIQNTTAQYCRRR